MSFSLSVHVFVLFGLVRYSAIRSTMWRNSEKNYSEFLFDHFLIVVVVLRWKSFPPLRSSERLCRAAAAAAGVLGEHCVRISGNGED